MLYLPGRFVHGHPDIKTTMRYPYLSREHLRSAVAKLDRPNSAPKPADSARGQHKVVKPTASRA